MPNRLKPKIVAFIISGIGVAVSTASSLVKPIISWVANLGAVFGAGAYSVFKNMETAESISANQRKLKEIVDRLRFEKYQSPDRPVSFADMLPHPNDNNVASFILDLRNAVPELNKQIPDSKWYVNFNLIAQAFFIITSIAINTFANLENSAELKNNPSTAKNILNMTVVSLCIFSQCVVHTFYVAPKLREIADSTEKSHSILSKAHDSLLFRAMEYSLFWNRYRPEQEEKLTMKLTTCNEQIASTEDALNQASVARKVKVAEYVQIQNSLEGSELNSEIDALNKNINTLNDLLTQQHSEHDDIIKRREQLNIDTTRFTKIRNDIDTEIAEVNAIIAHQP